MTISAGSLFSCSHVDVPDVIKYVFQIFGSNWQVYLLLSLCQLACVILTTIIYFGSLFAIAYEVFAVAMDSLNEDGNIRFLLEHVSGINTGGDSTTRLLNDSYSYYNKNSWSDDDQTNYYEDFYPDLQNIMNSVAESAAESAPGALIGFLLLTLVFIFVLVCISSIFQGAIIRVASETYAGSSATLGKSLDCGFKMCLKILGFRFLYGLVMLVCTIVVLILPMAAIGTSNQHVNPLLVLFLYLVLLVLCTLVSSVLIVAEPSIMVENLSSISSFKRAWGLCKNKICFNFCCILSLNCVGFAINLVVMKIAGVFAVYIAFVVRSFFAIMATILYNTLRMQSEEYTQHDLIQELALSPEPEFTLVSAEPSDEQPTSKNEIITAQVV